MDNILVVGNGFDLSLGLQTRYSDFANSRYWPFSSKYTVYSNCLKNYFIDFIDSHKDELDRVRWIDIEELLLSYALERRKKNDNSDELTSLNKQTYETLCSAFENYLKDIVKPQITKECKRFRYLNDLLTALKENQTYTQVYSFNYTPTKDILHDYFGYSAQVFHMHGSLEDTAHPLILGISDEYPIDDCYKFMRKSWYDSYEFHDLNDALFNADECVFYGISFGKADFAYYENFFKSIISNHNPGEKKKIINIFTYDEESRLKILNGFEEVGISMTRLMSVAQLRIHKISEYQPENSLSFDHYLEFLYHLSPNTKNGPIGTLNIVNNLAKNNY